MHSMLVEVHPTRKPAAPHRALLAAMLLFAVACALTAGMVWRRSGKTLGLRITPPGWGLSFQPPRLFEQERVIGTAGGSALRFLGVTRSRAPVTLEVRRIDVGPEVSSDAVVQGVAETHAARRPPDFRFPGPTGSHEKLGPRDAVEIVNQQIATVVRATVLHNGYALVVSLSVHGGALDAHLYHLFDQTCRSVEFL